MAKKVSNTKQILRKLIFLFEISHEWQDYDFLKWKINSGNIWRCAISTWQHFKKNFWTQILCSCTWNWAYPEWIIGYLSRDENYLILSQNKMRLKVFCYFVNHHRDWALSWRSSRHPDFSAALCMKGSHTCIKCLQDKEGVENLLQGLHSGAFRLPFTLFLFLLAVSVFCTVSYLWNFWTSTLQASCWLTPPRKSSWVLGNSKVH